MNTTLLSFFNYSTLAIDAGLFILALLVQRIIYPAFPNIHAASFTAWHANYTQRIGQIVAPLMLYQLIGGGSLLFMKNFSMIYMLRLGLILATWLDTFLRAVPLHGDLQSIQSLKQQQQLSAKLVQVNLNRTIIWLLILCIDIFLFSLNF